MHKIIFIMVMKLNFGGDKLMCNKLHPNFLEIIYGENFSNSIDHSILFSQSAKKRKLKVQMILRMQRLLFKQVQQAISTVLMISVMIM